MIRRTLAALAALWLLASPLSARTLFIVPRMQAPERVTDSDNGFVSERSLERNLALVTSLITATGGTYGVAFSNDVTTEDARNGRVWRGGPRPITYSPPVAGTTPGYYETYDAVVFFGPSRNTGTDVRCRADSMSRYNKYPKKPFLWLGNSSTMANTFDVNADAISSPADTSGATGGATVYGGGGVKLRGSTLTWTAHAYTRALPVATAPNSRTIIDPVLLSRTNAYEQAQSSGGNCKWCDSTFADNTNDSAFVIRKLWTDIPDAKPFVVAIFNQYAVQDSGSGVQTVTEGEMSIAMAALAVLDSASGGGVFGPKPVTFAAVMDKGLHRGARRGANGIFAADTAMHYAVVDSVKANGIPLTVAFDTDLDTLAARSRDMIVYSSVPSIRFTPQLWTGVLDTTKAGLGNTSRTRQVDVLGRWRNRAAVGDSLRHYVTGSDTTLAAGLYAMRARGDSILASYGIGSSRISRILLAPDDDYSPKFLRKSPRMDPPVDSVLYAMKLAGFEGVIVDAQDAEADANRGGAFAATNPRGWIAKPMNYRSRLVSEFKLLAHSGYMVMGGRAQYATFADSSAPYDSGAFGLHYQALSRAWYGGFVALDRSYDVFPYDNAGGDNKWPYWDGVQIRKADILYGTRGPSRILRFSASDFSGASPTPAANGFHVLKSLNNSFLAINRLAGRTVIRLGYPDEVVP